MRVLGVLLLGAYLGLVGWLTLRPMSVTWVYGSNIRPLATIDRVLLADPVSGSRTIAAGLLLLSPLGVLLPLVAGRINASTLGSFTRTVFTGAALSFTLECWQTTVPGRVFDVDSVILNTLGMAVAHLALVPGARARLRRRMPPDARPAPAAPIAAPEDAADRPAPPVRPTVGYEVAAQLHRGV